MEEVYINIKDLNECFLKKYLEKTFKKDLISINELLGLTEDLISEVEYLQDEYRDLQQDLEENYRPIPYAEQVGISDRDFF